MELCGHSAHQSKLSKLYSNNLALNTCHQDHKNVLIQWKRDDTTQVASFGVLDAGRESLALWIIGS